ncbi:MAG: hypothetical protein JST14_00525, partial [Bacteroidetes bacterium]|nr:hypothetical protein [Bacteroidota bacterium]
MGDTIQVSVKIPLDDDGMMGRECLECKKYFKLKPGTGLPTDHCHCPYCDYEGKSNTFWTPNQLEYAKSVGLNQVFRSHIKPSLDRLTDSFKELERSSRYSLIKFTVKSSGHDNLFPIKYYREEELETKLECDSCGLVFSIYGVFARCPDCNELNAFLIFDKSIEVTEKQFEIFTKPEIPPELRTQSLSSILSYCVSAFDGLGKELRKRRPTLYPDKPKNLFQNLYALNEHLNNLISDKHSNYPQLLKMFQVRHLYEHNMGVVDEDFIKRLPQYSSTLGRKFML